MKKRWVSRLKWIAIMVVMLHASWHKDVPSPELRLGKHDIGSLRRYCFAADIYDTVKVARRRDEDLG